MIVITNVFGPLNKGDWELFSRLVGLISARYPQERIAAIARDKDLTEQHFSSIDVGEQIGKTDLRGLLGRLQIIFFIAIALLSHWIRPLNSILPSKQRKSLALIANAKLIIACPGGFLEDSSKSYLTHLIPLVLAQLNGKKTILAPMSIGPIRGVISKFIVKNVLRRCEMIFVRETRSKEFLDQLGVSCLIADDLAFGLINEETLEGESNKEWIACTVIEWTFPTSATPDLARKNYISAISDALNTLQAQLHLPIYFIRQVSSDLPAISEVAQKITGRYVIGDEMQDPSSVVRILKSSRVVIASRFHSFIFSMAARCPGVAISYLPKTTGMLEMYDLSSQCLDIYDLSAEKILKAIHDIERDFAVYQKKIDLIGHRSQKSSLDFTESLARFLSCP